MTKDDFDVLAAKVLAGEATAEEAARLQEALAQDAELRDEFADLRAAWITLKEVGPLAGALDAPPAAPPRERLREWQAAVAQKFGSESEPASIPVERQQRETVFSDIGMWIRSKLRIPRAGAALAVVCLAAAIVTVVLLLRPPSSSTSPAPIAYLIKGEGLAEVHRKGKTIAVESVTSLRDTDEIRLGAQTSGTVITPNGPFAFAGPRTFLARSLAGSAVASTNGAQTNAARSAMRTALFQPRRQMLALLVTTRSGSSIAIYSPIGFTANLTPPILWKNQPGKTYDVSITDELAPTSTPLRRTAAVSPVEFTNVWPGRALATNGLYRLRLTETGKAFTASELTFRTLPQADGTLASKPAEPLLAAYQMLNGSPSRIGDALAILLTLPAEVADSELALRLKLFAFGQLGYQDDFEAVVARLEARK